MARAAKTSFDWGLWFLWLMASSVGWLLAGMVLPRLALAAAGPAVAALQLALLHRRIPDAWRWFVAGSLGWLAGWLVAQALLPAELDFLAGLLLGPAIGTAQWLVLRHEVQWAGWWIPVSTVAWASAVALMPAFLLPGVVVGLVTGVPIALLLQYPKQAARTGLR